MTTKRVRFVSNSVETAYGNVRCRSVEVEFTAQEQRFVSSAVLCVVPWGVVCLESSVFGLLDVATLVNGNGSVLGTARNHSKRVLWCR